MDTGPDSAVELGVKFRSDVAGVITGIRFYKSSANTGTHVGNLWTSAGTRLATATFAGETASGWQQVNFAKPVAITANTVYVASYHANSGHYSADLNYFSTKGMDTPPLHALANGVSGVNGVYVYGTSSAFPKNAWQASNYWVDVSFQSGTAPTLTSIAVAPVNPTIVTGGSQQFTATGTYVSGTQNITSQVTWKSSNTATATISAGGLATAAATGTTSISAALSGATASSLLTVKSGSVAITTGTLPNGSLNVAYTGALAASGGTAPYVWSISSGALPSGLTMNASGAITGTPIVTGTFSLTAKVTDASNPIQTASKALSIIVSTASTSTGTNIWPSTTVPKLVDGGADSSVELGVKFKSDVAGTITGIRFYKAGTNKGTHVGNLWTITGTKLATVTFTGETASGWQQVNFATPVAITANTVYVASYHATTGHYSADLGYFSKGVDNPPLHALANGVSGANGIYAYGKNSAFPNQSWSSANYWVDVIFKP